MDWSYFRMVLGGVQHIISALGVTIILAGILLSAYKFLVYVLLTKVDRESRINEIRLTLGRFLILGLEFIVAADLIGTTTTPDYYELGILAIIVGIRTLLSFSLNKELMGLDKKKEI